MVGKGYGKPNPMLSARRALSGRCRFLADNRRVCRVSSTVLGGGRCLGFETRRRRFNMSASGVGEIGGQKHIDRKPTRFGWSPPG